MTTIALRRLERALVSERAELVVRSIVADLVLRWDIARRNDAATPEATSFIRDLIDDGLLLSSGPKALNYIDLCGRDGSTPDPDRLMRILLPWHS